MGLLSFLFGNSGSQPQQPQQQQIPPVPQGLLSMKPLNLKTDLPTYNDYAEQMMTKGQQPLPFAQWQQQQMQLAKAAAEAAAAAKNVPPSQ